MIESTNPSDSNSEIEQINKDFEEALHSQNNDGTDFDD